ncbi:MAG: hypothetical protein Q8O18_09910 [Deltaproteobacteria bacterium]|jgi:hypothetical protein|nr:hypothetical protein [Deltaproteobacteria bacterium]
MPEIDLLTYDRWLVASRKASTAYGNRFLSDDPTGEEPYSGAWNVERGQYQQKRPYLLTPAAGQGTVDDLISGYFKVEDPFTQADLVETEEEQLQEIIFKLRTSPYISCREVADRLLILLNDAKEDDPTSIGIVLGSLRNFYNFFQLHTDLKCPSISLTPDNNIYVSWRAKKNRVFSVHFLPSADVRFVIFKPNDRHPEKQIRLSGTATTDILKETVAPHGVWSWISE